MKYVWISKEAHEIRRKLQLLNQVKPFLLFSLYFSILYASICVLLEWSASSKGKICTHVNHIRTSLWWSKILFLIENIWHAYVQFLHSKKRNDCDFFYVMISISICNNSCSETVASFVYVLSLYFVQNVGGSLNSINLMIKT